MASRSIILLVVIGLGLCNGLEIGLSPDKVDSRFIRDNSDDDNVDNSAKRRYTRAAVATDAAECSEVGVDILKKDGSAVDAAIASLLCVGTVNLHSTGIGGGGFMIFYNASSKDGTAYDYRETAPENVREQLYTNDADRAKKGGLAIAVPGEVRGMWQAWENHGRLNWSELFEPAAKIAEEGFKVSRTLADAIEAKQKDYDDFSPGLRELLMLNGKPLVEGDILKRPAYAKTLRAIGQNGADYFYSNLSMTIVAELKDLDMEVTTNGVTVDDFRDYRSIEKEPIMTTLSDGLRVMGIPPPSSGAVLALILNILDGYNFTENDFNALGYHRIVESFKFAYGQWLQLGDPAFSEDIAKLLKSLLSEDTATNMRNNISDSTTYNPYYYLDSLTCTMDTSTTGTSHLSVLAENGDAVAATSTINTYFGSLILSNATGIIFNNEMNCFYFPDKKNSYMYDFTELNHNGIKSGKRPRSSTTPTIILDKSGKVKMVVGASGGPRIITAVAQVILDVFRFGKSLDEAISTQRLHHVLCPNEVQLEDYGMPDNANFGIKNLPAEIIAGLRNRSHTVITNGTGISIATIVQGILVDGNRVYAESDPRKGGEADGYNSGVGLKVLVLALMCSLVFSIFFVV